tara:strand:- start:52 stop:474 length:423 start_codon:yes stop_codon:yes gene_type:complete
MAESFPKMTPTTRDFTMGDYPSTTYRSMSGVIFKRSFGNKQTGYELNLTFKNIGDTIEFRTGCGTVQKILNHYEIVDGTFEGFTVPDIVFSGMGTTNGGLKSSIQAPPNILWRYAKPPKVTSVITNLSTVTVSLTGELQT